MKTTLDIDNAKLYPRRIRCQSKVQSRPGDLAGTVRFFQELSCNTARSAPDSFSELFFREASRLLERLWLGGRVSQSDWRTALRNVRVVLKARPMVTERETPAMIGTYDARR